MELESWIFVLTMAMALGMSSIPKIEDRVVGGKKAERGMFPYVAGIKVTFKSKYDDKIGFSICTGTILTERWILTAGHCCMKEGYTLTRGEYTVGEIDIRKNLKTFSVHIIHPYYYANKTESPKSEFTYNDLCLVKTKEKMELNKYVKKVCVSSSNIPSGTCFTIGFGILVNPNETRKEENWLMHYATLNYAILKPNIPNTIMLYVENKYPSSGDSGGPLICNNKQLGVATTVGTIDKKAMLIYMITGKYKDWIEEVVESKVIDHCESISYELSPSNIGDMKLSNLILFFGIFCDVFLLMSNCNIGDMDLSN